MIHVDTLINELKIFAQNQISNVATTTPLLSFMSPFISRALNNIVLKIEKPMYLIADELGYIDIENILEEIQNNLINTLPFALNLPVVGNIVIGGGNVKINIPFANKDLVLNAADVLKFKDLLINKS